MKKNVNIVLDGIYDINQVPMSAVLSIVAICKYYKEVLL